MALDANFRLKCKDRGFDANSRLGNCLAYFVDHQLFEKELVRVKGAKLEKSTCDSTHSAIERANSRVNDGYAVTGVVAVIDSRHGFIRPTSVVNLQKGERW